jgi:hypothetical protein
MPSAPPGLSDWGRLIQYFLKVEIATVSGFHLAWKHVFLFVDYAAINQQ